MRKQFSGTQCAQCDAVYLHYILIYVAAARPSQDRRTSISVPHIHARGAHARSHLHKFSANIFVVAAAAALLANSGRGCSAQMMEGGGFEQMRGSRRK